MSTSITIKLLEPKARGLLRELELLGLIEIEKDSIQELKAKYLDKLSGKNLLDLDPKTLDTID